MNDSERTFQINLSESEIRYIFKCGEALALNIPKKVLPTYTTFTIDQITAFEQKILIFMSENEIEL
ncbi:hypothetical protein ACP90_19690 [Labrenzia sp. CP4]|jgi:hypothetical protein|uniref:hypothetical protein n=1 Tax=Labrenzia sp. CP4 TaxID=1674922 RepID=UPI000784D4AD|nr:hypothetical protein [Labrenzia sp. CP4]AMN54270.1 hypothetical protein ACP90_19690 [Labrenzia sp. CP4]MCR9280320.1 hypothetical protein [Paracoccaceae bacterium]